MQRKFVGIKERYAGNKVLRGIFYFIRMWMSPSSYKRPQKDP